MAIHVQLIGSTVLYFFACLSGILIAITIGIAKENVDGSCLLYCEPKASNGTQFGNAAICDFSLYLPVISSCYALVLAIYHGYAAFVAFREQHIGRTMWIMPWLLVNSLVMAITFIAACVFSVGLHLTCTKLIRETKHRCSDIIDSISKTSSRTYIMMQLAQDSYWVSAVLWVIIFGVSIVRLMRNLKARAANNYVDPTISDIRPIAELTPTA